MNLEDDMREVVDACRAKLNAQADLDQAVHRRDRALWRIVHEDGVRKYQVSGMVVARLQAEGFTPEMVAASGVSPARVRQAVDR